MADAHALHPARPQEAVHSAPSSAVQEEDQPDFKEIADWSKLQEEKSKKLKVKIFEKKQAINCGTVKFSFLS